MGPHVRFEIASLFTRVVTLCTVEGIFPRMCPHVSFEIGSLIAREVTLSAPEWFFTCMFPYMVFKMGRICGRILTMVTNEELLPVMQSFLEIFFFCHYFHLQGMLFMELASRLEDN